MYFQRSLTVRSAFVHYPFSVHIVPVCCPFNVQRKRKGNFSNTVTAYLDITCIQVFIDWLNQVFTFWQGAGFTCTPGSSLRPPLPCRLSSGVKTVQELTFRNFTIRPFRIVLLFLWTFCSLLMSSFHSSVTRTYIA